MKIFYVAGILAFGICISQTHRFYYDLKFKKDSTQIEPSKSLMILDINPDEIKFYDNAFLEKEAENEKTGSQNTSWTKQIPVTRKKNSDKNINYSMIEFQLYSYVTEDPIVWNLTNETKEYDKFRVQKATSNFGGRQWTAWFTKEIPFSEGPYKFKGLPGLIVQIQDSKEQYNFALVKNEKLEKTYDTKNILEIRYGNKPIPVTEKIYITKAKEYFNDPLHRIRESLRNGTTKSYDDSGIRYTNAEQLVPLIKDEQKYILKYNNPIEKNKAIKYQ
ncbi:GLPGLI family protein [Chryseobacterium sp. MMS23-Vi53]|uniref:GLPGLI family protein n=1 Tax=Chryseobacterium sp. MMS23-Vi53 TaxID=3386644 RepID=UPI0039E85525